MNNTNWDSFRYFIAAAECGSLTGAAKQLDSNQPTVGRQIDALESALGIKLFQRSVKGLILTEEGATVFEQSQLMRSVADNIQRIHQGNDEDISGTVRVALPEGICIEVLAPLLPSFYGKYPYINLILNASSNTANLTRGEADIAVRLFRPKQSNLVAKRLGRLTMGLFASSSYLKTHGHPATPGELKHHRIITYGDQLSTLAENEWLVKSSASSILSSDNTIARLKATVAGVGISVQPQLLCRMYRELVPVLEDTKLPDHEVWITYHNDLRHLARIRAVVGFISENLKLKN
ncbi:MAG: LysR family transcriptional regulator [Gammaproteobacteria bacterium]|nr:LysR family transcriptional regulator [Gammaproteobacteria bacterium]